MPTYSKLRDALTPPVFLALVCSFALVVSDASAQFEAKPMAIGSLHHTYSEKGQEGYPPVGGIMEWEGIYQRSGTVWYNALWVSAKDVQGEDGTTYPVRTTHIGPRASGVGEMFPQEFRTVSRFEPPLVQVDGLESFDQHHDNDEVDPSLRADRMIYTKVNTITGITIEREVHGFSQMYHDNYHLVEYTFTNTGNIDGDDEAENAEQTLEGVYFHFQRRPQHWGGGGSTGMNDVVGDGMEDYETDLRASYAWFQPGPNAHWSLGYPLVQPEWFAVEGDTLGRLNATQFTGTATVHADASATVETDDPAQPSTTIWLDNDDPLMAISNDAFNVDKMQREYDVLSGGHMYPHHADLIDTDGNFATVDGGNPTMGLAGGVGYGMSYGPYTLAPGETVNLVLVEAVDGLDRQEAMEIGRQFKRSGEDETALVSYRGEQMTKNEWVISGRDSLFQTFERAIANYESGLAIPQPPPPPSKFDVTSGVDRIMLEWEVPAGSNATGYEIYRSIEALEGAVSNDFKYELIHTAGAQERSFEDTDVERGVSYYYYLQAVGPVNNDGTGLTPTGVPLKSGRYWTQTYDPAILKRPPGETTSSFRIVPNPYNLGSAKEVRWPDQQDKLGFLDVPGNCTISIYTQLGELVETIEHTDGSGDVYWDLTTKYRQVVVSGIYIAVVDNHDTGEQVVKKFVIIR